MEKNVLMITYGFPPLGGATVLRTVKFAKYLPYFGWNPIVSTVRKDKEHLETGDTSFLNELPKSIKIYRSDIVELYDLYRLFGGKKKQFSEDSNLLQGKNTDTLVHRVARIGHSLFIPDSQIGWYPFAMRESVKIFENNDIDVIYSTSPPQTAHLIAKSLAQKYKKPWVADFRDPWLRTALLPKKHFLVKNLNVHMEKSVLEKATKTVAAWPNILNDMKERYDDFDIKKTVVISNGFDELDFLDIIPKTFQKFTIIYTGKLHAQRNAESLLRAIYLFLDENPELRNDIQIVFVGGPSPSTNSLLEEMSLSNVVAIIQNVPHRESLSYLLGADILFLNTLEDYVPGKLFEYLRSKKPILALVPNDTTVAKIVSSTKSGVVIDPTNTAEIKDVIFEMYKKYKKGTLKLDREDDLVIYQYERKELTRKLAEVFNEVR